MRVALPIFSSVLLCALVYCEFYLFHLSVVSCRWPLESPHHTIDLGGYEGRGVRAVVISDVHVLGNKKRTYVERLWVDWQLQKSLWMILNYLQPDMLIVLGDIFDEGGRSSSVDWQVLVVMGPRGALPRGRVLCLSRVGFS